MALDPRRQAIEEVGMIVRPLLATLRQLGEQITTFEKGAQRQVCADSTRSLLMSVPGIGALSSLVYVSTVEDHNAVYDRSVLQDQAG